MQELESKIKELIISRYGSLKKFSEKININIYKSKIKSQKFEKNILTITKNRIYCKCNHEKS